MYISYQATTAETFAITTAEVNLTTFNVPLNAFEIELYFDPQTTKIADVMPHANLFEPQYTLLQTVDEEKGVIYLSCGSNKPFIAGAELTPVLTVIMESAHDVIPTLSFASRTGFHIHDAFGAREVSRIIGASI